MIFIRFLSVTILDGAGYSLQTDEESREQQLVVSIDDLPEISIAEIAPVDEADGMFSFKLSSDYTPVAGYPLTIIH